METFRAFKKEYGVTPMQYYKDLQIDRNETKKLANKRA